MFLFSIKCIILFARAARGSCVYQYKMADMSHTVVQLDRRWLFIVLLLLIESIYRT
jgi:hypothetical protein